MSYLGIIYFSSEYKNSLPGNNKNVVVVDDDDDTINAKIGRLKLGNNALPVKNAVMRNKIFA